MVLRANSGKLAGRGQCGSSRSKLDEWNHSISYQSLLLLRFCTFFLLTLISGRATGRLTDLVAKIGSNKIASNVTAQH